MQYISNYYVPQGRRRNTCKECFQNFMEIDQEFTENKRKTTNAGGTWLQQLL